MIDQTAFYTEVGRRIHRARRGRMTQEQLANSVRLTRTSITNIERGRQKLLLHTLADIAEALRVEPASLLPQDAGVPERDLDHSLRKRTKGEQKFIRAAVRSAKGVGK